MILGKYFYLRFSKSIISQWDASNSAKRDSRRCKDMPYNIEWKWWSIQVRDQGRSYTHGSSAPGDPCFREELAQRKRIQKVLTIFGVILFGYVSQFIILIRWRIRKRNKLCSQSSKRYICFETWKQGGHTACMESIQAPFTIVTIVWVVIILLGYDTNTPGLSDPVLQDRYLLSINYWE